MQQTNSDRRTVPLPVGHIDASGEMHTTAEVRPITGADEYRVGLSKEYTARPIDSVYEMLMLSRCVTKLGSRTQVTLSDIEQLHPDDLEVLKRAIHELTYKPPEPAEPPTRSTAAPVSRPLRNRSSARFASSSANTSVSQRTGTLGASSRKARASSRVRFATDRIVRSFQSFR